MTSLEIIKEKIKKLYNTNPNVHINVSMSNPRIELKNELVKIKGVYPHIFQIEEGSTGSVKCRTHQYTEVLTRRIEILELQEN